MVFSSLTFLYFFLPCVTVLYYVCKNRAWRNGVLLIFSLVFYSWGEPKYILLLLLAAAEAYIGGLIIDAAAQRPRRKKTAMAVTAVLLLANLFVFKYLGFVCGNLGIRVREIILPIGISFYTFQILSYVIDLYRGKTRVQKNYLLLLLYVSFFPQLIAGPSSAIRPWKERWPPAARTGTISPADCAGLSPALPKKCLSPTTWPRWPR